MDGDVSPRALVWRRPVNTASVSQRAIAAAIFPVASAQRETPGRQRLEWLHCAWPNACRISASTVWGACLRPLFSSINLPALALHGQSIQHMLRDWPLIGCRNFIGGRGRVCRYYLPPLREAFFKRSTCCVDKWPSSPKEPTYRDDTRRLIQALLKSSSSGTRFSLRYTARISRRAIIVCLAFLQKVGTSLLTQAGAASRDYDAVPELSWADVAFSSVSCQCPISTAANPKSSSAGARLE
jgi:hypothetical protein